MSDICTELVVCESNLSVAWAKAFLWSISPRKELIPLIVMVTELNNGTDWEDTVIRDLLDNSLQKMGKQSCNTVANTIFPESLWNPKVQRKRLYERYLRILPAIRKCPKNRYGVYFERLIDFDGSGYEDTNGNQLEHIIASWLSGNHRRSALQVAVFDPRRDQTNQRQRGFPCLQHVTFTPYHDRRRLSINAFYATQYLFERAYGNYLGLCHLGQFVAHEFGLELVQMNCMVGIGMLEEPTSFIEELAIKIEERLSKLEQK